MKKEVQDGLNLAPLVLQSMISLRKSGLGYRKISDEIKNKFGKRIYFPQVHKILNRPHNRHF